LNSCYPIYLHVSHREYNNEIDKFLLLQSTMCYPWSVIREGMLKEKEQVMKVKINKQVMKEMKTKKNKRETKTS